MSGPVATCAGSSGGAQPPRDDPPRLPFQCESAAPPAPRKRKGRGPAKLEAMLREIAESGSKIRVTFDEETKTFKGLHREGTLFDSAIGYCTRKHCESFHDRWSQIPLHQRREVFEELLDWFDIDFTYDDGVYRDMVERDAKKCYSEWKNDLHVHFQKNGGIEDLARAEASLPPTVQNREHWLLCCKRFSSVEFLKKSTRNSANRGKKNSNSKQGRIPYTRHRANKTDPETLEPKSVIDNWKELNPDAEETHLLLEERVAEVAALAPDHIDELAIMADTLGTRRGHMNGVGPSLSRRISAAATQPSASRSAAAITEQYERIMGDLQGRLDQQSLLAVAGHMRDVFRQLVPHVQLPDVNVPPPPPPASSDPSSSGPRSSDGDDQAGDE